jgi:hypothetical protein
MEELSMENMLRNNNPKGILLYKVSNRIIFAEKMDE